MTNYKIRKIQPEDIKGVEVLIKTVMPEFGADGPGFAIHDAEVLDMYTSYNRPGHVYYVVTDGDKILGGGGIGPLEGKICELRKMYFMDQIRGKGLGQKVMDLCLTSAKDMGYEKCYLETLEAMVSARKLYERNGFQALNHCLGNTGHFSCDRFYLKDL